LADQINTADRRIDQLVYELYGPEGRGNRYGGRGNAMIASAKSRHGVRVRLTDERWAHIVEEHCELAGMREEVLETIASAERVLGGSSGELLAVRTLETGKALVVIYREIDNHDGFVITAFVTSRIGSLDRRNQVWPSQP